MSPATTAVVTDCRSILGDRQIMPVAHSTAKTNAVRMRLLRGLMALSPAEG